MPYGTIGKWSRMAAGPAGVLWEGSSPVNPVLGQNADGRLEVFAAAWTTVMAQLAGGPYGDVRLGPPWANHHQR